MGAMDPGASPPGFQVVSSFDENRTVNSHELEGKPILIDFWATWCPPCRASMPHRQELWLKYKDQGLQVLAVSSEDATTVNSYRTKENLELPMYLDPGQKMQAACGADSLPTTIVIGKNGKVLYAVTGTSTDVEKELDDAVAGAMK